MFGGNPSSVRRRRAPATCSLAVRLGRSLVRNLSSASARAGPAMETLPSASVVATKRAQILLSLHSASAGQAQLLAQPAVIE
eukprot:SAG11_NODE_389_length_9870_cov_7.646812_11_plen_82_part_00